MPTTQQPPAAQEQYEFTPKLDARWALNLEQLLAVGAFGALFVVLNYIPLRATDIWGHAAYGHWMLDRWAIPEADPWMPLATGMKVVDSAWLSQLVFGAVDRYLGPESLSHLFAAVSLLAYLVWARVFFLQTGRVWLSVAATGLMIFIGWSRFATIRPENFAALCFALLFLLLVPALVRRKGEVVAPAKESSFGWLAWLGVPAVFAFWANLHGTFFCGLAVLGCFLLGRVAEVAWQSRSLPAILRDGEVRRWVWLTELALLATLLNPYGLDLWIYTFKFAGNPNLATILEWQPLVIQGVGGRQFAVSVVLLLIVWRHSRLPVRPAEVLLLAVFGLATIGGVRMLGWYAPVFAAVIAPHLGEIAVRLLPSRRRTPATLEADEIAEGTADAGADASEPSEAKEFVLPPGHSFRYSLVALLLIWIAFAISPSSQLIFQKSRTPRQLYGPDTPIELAAYLNEAYAGGELGGGIVFHPQWWGDWLKREGPGDFQPFVTTNIHLVPPQVWRDYTRILGVGSGWDRSLSRYDINTVIVDKRQQAALLAALHQSEDWTRRYEDEQAAVFTRRGPSTRQPRTPLAAVQRPMTNDQ